MGSDKATHKKFDETIVTAVPEKFSAETENTEEASEIDISHTEQPHTYVTEQPNTYGTEQPHTYGTEPPNTYGTEAVPYGEEKKGDSEVPEEKSDEMAHVGLDVLTCEHCQVIN